jgi:hypothetical protein
VNGARVAGALASFLVAAPAWAQGAGPAPAGTDAEARLRSLEERVARMGALEERVARQEKELDAQRAELARLRSGVVAAPSGDTANAATGTGTAPAEGFIVARPQVAPLGDMRIQLGLLLQADAVAYRQSAQDEIDPSTHAPLNTQRFYIRRAQPRISVESKYVGAALMIDGNTNNGPQMRLLEAHVDARVPGKDGEPPPIAAQLGTFRTPFGFETYQPDSQRLWLERTSSSRALFANGWDLGARLHGGWRFLRYSLAMMDGSPVGSGAFDLQDPTRAKDLVFRVGVDAVIANGVRVMAGLSGLTGQGFHAATPSTKDGIAWFDDNENGIVELTELRPVSGTAGTPSQTFDRFAIGADARAVARIGSLGDLVVQLEIYRGSNLDRGLVPSDPIVAKRNVRQLGWTVGASQELTRFAVIGVRYDAYDPDSDARDQAATGLVPAPRTFSTLALTAAARLPPGRLILEYDLNRNPFGRDATGAPTTLKDDMFSVRAEVAF